MLWRLRFPFAAALLGCAVALAVAEVRPPPPVRVAVVVAARALEAGVPLTADDVRVARLPPEAAADGTHASTDAVLGRAPVLGLPAGLPVADALLHDDDLVTAGPPGTVVVPVRLADPGVAALLRPGDHVDLFAAATTGAGAPVADRLASRALVLPQPASDPGSGDDGGGLLGGPAGGSEAGPLTLVAVPAADASALAGASAWAGISAVLVE